MTDAPQTHEPNPDPTVLTGSKNVSNVDYRPDPSQSIPLPANRQKIVDAITSLYSGGASESLMRVYASKAIYDDPWSYCDTRFKIAGQWYGIPKIMSKSETKAVQVVENSDSLIVFKMRQLWVPKGLGWANGGKEVDCLVSLALDKEGEKGDGQGEEGFGGERVRYHKDMWNEKDYSHAGLGKVMKTLNGDQLTKVWLSCVLRENDWRWWDRCWWCRDANDGHRLPGRRTRCRQPHEFDGHDHSTAMIIDISSRKSCQIALMT